MKPLAIARWLIPRLTAFGQVYPDITLNLSAAYTLARRAFIQKHGVKQPHGPSRL